MVFSSITFLFYFLPLFLLTYYVLPWRNAVLLAASLLFYAWGDLRQVPLLLASIGISYTAGLFVVRSGRVGRVALALGVGGNLALLVWYKYAGFLAAQLAAALHWRTSRCLRSRWLHYRSASPSSPFRASRI